MAATPQDIKAFFALSGNNPEVTNGQLTKVRAWLSSATGKENPDEDDLVDHIYKTLKDQAVADQRRRRTETF